MGQSSGGKPSCVCAKRKICTPAWTPAAIAGSAIRSGCGGTGGRFIYINFCDPWPKSNQKKRRLTHGNFLKKYRQVLKEGGQIHFKTDNDKLFEWSLEEIPQFGFQLSEVPRDLHANGPVGVMTDYEAKFYGEGKNINRCVATMIDWTEPAEETETAE